MRTDTPSLRLLQGDGVAPTPWLNVPATALGRSWNARNSVRSYRIARADVQKGLARGLRQPILDLWALVLGEIPPVPLSGRYSHLLPQVKSGAFTAAHACFRGVRRPVGNDDSGFDTVAFISKPSLMFTYEPTLGCVIKPVAFANDLVFVTYVKLDYPENAGINARSRNGDGPSGEVITHWGAVEADDAAGDLPIDFDERYRLQLW